MCLTCFSSAEYFCAFLKSTFSQIIPCYNLTSTYLSIFPKTQFLELLSFHARFQTHRDFLSLYPLPDWNGSFLESPPLLFIIFIPFSDAFQSQTSTNSFFRSAHFHPLPDILSIKSADRILITVSRTRNTKYPSFRIAYAPKVQNIIFRNELILLSSAQNIRYFIHHFFRRLFLWFSLRAFHIVTSDCYNAIIK